MCEETKIIRGARIIEQLGELVLTEQSTYMDLERNVLNFAPVSTKRQNAIDPVRIVSLKMIPFIGTKNLDVSAVANSDGAKYDPKVIFNGVTFEDEDQANNVTFTGGDGEEYHVRPLLLSQHNVRVRCQCLDFFWRFAPFNAKDKSLIGTKPKAYKSKTNRGPVNVQQVPGVCKHLIATIKALKHSGIVK